MDLPITAFQGIIVLIVVGFLLIAAEVFVPGMILGILGGLLLVAAVVLSYMEYGVLTGSLVAGGVAVFTFVGFFIWIFNFPKTGLGRRIVNSGQVGRGDDSGKSELLGQEGVSLTPLRPSGMAKIEGHRIDVIADSAFIESGAPLVVVQVEGNRVIVRKKL
jgi:membrane-bound serine protease (ClpP class)